MSVDIVDLLRRIYTNGTDVLPADDGRVRLTGNRPPDELLTAVRDQRDAVRIILLEQGIGRADDGFPSPLPRRYVVPPACGPQATCARLGPCSRYVTGRSCQSVRRSGSP